MSEGMTRISLVGRSGRMGMAIESAAQPFSDLAFASPFSRSQQPNSDEVDVVIDFSSPEGFRSSLAWCLVNGVPFVSGTTGLSKDDHRALEQAAAKIPVLLAANMSLGVALLRHLAEKSARSLGDDFDAEIMEIHHKRKKDSPSGTALALADSIDAGRGLSSKSHRCSSREGMVGARPDGELGVFGLRGGDVVGEHTVYFFGEGERLELTHRASDRGIFARGALRCARWIVGKSAGRYTIEDVLGLV